MSRIYPSLSEKPPLFVEPPAPPPRTVEAHCGQIFSKGVAITTEIVEKMQHAELGPEKTHICGREFRTGQLWVLAGLVLLFSISFSGTVIFWFTEVFDNAVISSLIITNGSGAYALWKRPPANAYIKAYLFNYTNVEEFERGDAKKLNVKEVGPFTYKEVLERVNVQFADDGTVSYQDRRIYNFIPEMSPGRKQSDRIVGPNIPMMTTAAMNKHSYVMTRLFMSGLLKGLSSKPFVTLPAHRFLWGYDDNLYDFAKKVMVFKKALPFEKMGILAAMNGTSKKIISMNTGEFRIDRLGYAEEIDGSRSTQQWSTEECNRLGGSDGTEFPPKVIRNKQPIYIYLKDMCRRLPLKFQKEVRILNDKITAFKYVMPENVFDHPDSNPENQCYCDLDTGACPPQGVFNATSCSFGTPLFVSFPHFHRADPLLKEAITGLNPSPKSHETYIHLHPTMGFPIGGATRLQMNIQIQKSFGLSQLDRYEDQMLLPIVWLQFGMEEKELPEALAAGIYDTTFTLSAVELIFQYGTLLMSLVTLTAILIILRSKLNDRTPPRLPE